MSQIRAAVSVTSGSPIVTTAVNLSASVRTGFMFALSGAREAYFIAETPTWNGTLCTVRLTAPFVGVTNTVASGLFVTDYTTPDLIPVIAPGDTNTATIFTEAMYRLQKLITAVSPEGFGVYANAREEVLAAASGILESTATATSSATAAAASATAASESARAVESSVADAAVSKNAASASAASAADSALAAATSATAAADSASAASSNKSASEVCAANALASASASSTNAASASDSASSAALSSNAATSSATLASESAQHAALSATSAEASKNEATLAATSAAASATSVAASASAATSAANEAALSASSAATSAASATSDAAKVKTSETNAATSASASETSAQNASISAASALDYKNQASVSAMEAASAAANASESSSKTALVVETAQAWATQTATEVVVGQGYGAKKYAQDAAASAAEATESAVFAGDVKTETLGLKTEFEAARNQAQAWATQTETEVVVGQGYGAKKYAQDASSSSVLATSAANSAAESKTISSNSADLAASSSTSAANSAAEANASSISAANSAASASASATSATGSATSASDSSASATVAQNKAKLWADAESGVEVETGKYSAKHWAALATGGIVGAVINKGTFDASKNDSPVSPLNGHCYKISVAGKVDGILTVSPNDWIIYNGTTWDKVGSSGEVSSVNGMVGDVFVTEISGNAGTASKLALARDLTFEGDVSGAAQFDGSENVLVQLTIATLDFNKISGRPNTLSGYGITDAQGALGYAPVNKAGDSMTGALTAPELFVTQSSAQNANLNFFNANTKAFYFTSSADRSQFALNYCDDNGDQVGTVLVADRSSGAVAFNHDVKVKSNASIDGELTTGKAKVLGNIELQKTNGTFGSIVLKDDSGTIKHRISCDAGDTFDSLLYQHNEGAVKKILHTGNIGQVAELVDLGSWRTSVASELPTIESRLNAIESGQSASAGVATLTAMQPLLVVPDDCGTFTIAAGAGVGQLAAVAGFGLYRFDPDSTEIADNETVLAPESGTGRWLLVSPHWDFVWSYLSGLLDDLQGQIDTVNLANPTALANLATAQTNITALQAAVAALQAKTLVVSATLDFPSIAAGASATLTITVAGAATADRVVLTPPSTLPNGVVPVAYVSSADTVTVRLNNVTASAIDPAAMTYLVTVIKS